MTLGELRITIRRAKGIYSFARNLGTLTIVAKSARSDSCV